MLVHRDVFSESLSIYMTILNKLMASSDHGRLLGILMFLFVFNVSSKLNTY